MSDPTGPAAALRSRLGRSESWRLKEALGVFAVVSAWDGTVDQRCLWSVEPGREAKIARGCG